jgi:hypothetical protein
VRKSCFLTTPTLICLHFLFHTCKKLNSNVPMFICVYTPWSSLSYDTHEIAFSTKTTSKSRTKGRSVEWSGHDISQITKSKVNSPSLSEIKHR